MPIYFLIQASLTNHLINEKKEFMISQGNIVADQIAPSVAAKYSNSRFSYIEKVVKGLSLRVNSRVLVLNRSGTVIIDAYDDYNDTNQSDIEEVSEANLGISSSRLYTFDSGREIIYTGVPIYYKGAIVGSVFISSSPDDVYDRIREITHGFNYFSAIAVTVIVLISMMFADILSKPLEKLIKVVREVSKKNLNQRVIITSNDEIGELADSVNQMVGKLYDVDDMRKQFVSNVSHELRTPITSLKIISDTLIDNKPTEMAIYEDFMTDINSELDRLSAIIDALLLMSKLDKDDVVLDYQRVSLNHLILKCVQMLMPIAKKGQVELVSILTEDVELYCDELKIRQCLINIINNAIKYTPVGGNVRIVLSSDKKYALIQVIDTGVGIPKKDLSHIFDRFYRVDSARSRNTGGSGLGLSIAEQIIKHHGGFIDVNSKLGKGSVFVIGIPYGMESNYETY